jgi:hypothetical protein
MRLNRDEAVMRYEAKEDERSRASAKPAEWNDRALVYLGVSWLASDSGPLGANSNQEDWSSQYENYN